MRGGEKFYQNMDNTRQKNTQNSGEFTQPMS